MTVIDVAIHTVKASMTWSSEDKFSDGSVLENVSVLNKNNQRLLVSS